MCDASQPVHVRHAYIQCTLPYLFLSVCVCVYLVLNETPDKMFAKNERHESRVNAVKHASSSSSNSSYALTHIKEEKERKIQMIVAHEDAQTHTHKMHNNKRRMTAIWLKVW